MEYRIGDVITGKVTGIQSYGVFVNLDKDTQGLIHISECKHGYVTKLDELVKVDEDIEAMIIDIDEYTKKISLSLRTLEKISIQPQPSRKKHRRKRHTPQIGFKSLRNQMPIWIKEAKQDEQIRMTEMDEVSHTK